jgi:uncharacterized protein (DUF1501 family)
MTIDRRRFLQYAGLGAGVALGAAGWLRDAGGGTGDGGPSAGPAGTGAEGASAPTAGPAGDPSGSRPAAVAGGGRRLVVVELDGGNDGLSTLVPYGLGRYHDLRSRTAVAGEDVIDLDGTVGLHRSLARLHERGLAVVQGVGTTNPDGSHFGMLQRWWAGDVAGSGAARGGFFGRLADQLGDPATVAVAVSIGSGSHPALASERVSTMALPSPDAADYLTGASDDETRARFQRGFAAMMRDDGDARWATARRAGASAVAFAGTLAGLEEPGGDYPGSDLANGLRLAAALLASDPGVRIVHVPAGLDFDTHEDHPGRHPGLLEDVDASVDALLADLAARGIGEDVVVMTISEFGRTARDNGSNGLDHGTASVALLAGAVRPGLYGQLPDLAALDDDDQLVATVGLDEYYATIAEGWFGLDTRELLGGAPRPISDQLFR